MPKFITNFEGIEKNISPEQLKPGIYEVEIKSIKERKPDSGSYGLNITVAAAETEGENVGLVSYGTLWIRKAGEKEFSTYGKQRLMEIMDALSIDYDPVGDFEFDTDDWVGQFVKVEVATEKSNGLDKDGKPYPDKVQIKTFLTDEEAEELIAWRSRTQDLTGGDMDITGGDILDEVKEEKPVKKVAPKKKVTKKTTPEAETTEVVEAIEEPFIDDEKVVEEKKAAPKKKAVKKVVEKPAVEDEVIKVEEETNEEIVDEELDALFDDLE